MVPNRTGWKQTKLETIGTTRPKTRLSMTPRVTNERPEVAQTVTATKTVTRNHVVPHVIVRDETEARAMSGQPQKARKQKHQKGRRVTDPTGIVNRVATPVKNHHDAEEGVGVPGNEPQRVMPIAAKPAHVINRVILLIQTNVQMRMNALIQTYVLNPAKALRQMARDLEDAGPEMTRATANVPNEIALSENDLKDSDPKDSDPSR